MPRNGYGHMVHDHYVSWVRDLKEKRADRLRAVKTKTQALAYQERVRDSIRRALGPMPRKTALNPQIVDVIEQRSFRIEKLLFESRPGCLVTANLYVPNRIDG